MSDGLTCARCRRMSALPSSAERAAGRGYVCRFCGRLLLPAPTPRLDKELLIDAFAALRRASGATAT